MNQQIPPDHASHRMRVWVAYVCVVFFWGSTYLAIRIGVGAIPPAALVGIRFLLASGILLLVVALKKLPWPSRSDAKSLAIVGIFLFVGGNGCVAWAEQWVPSGLTALILASTPLFMSTLDALLPGGHRLHALGWVGIVVGFGGVALLVVPGGGSAEEQVSPAGVAALILASLSWSIGSVYSRRHRVGGHLIAGTAIEMLIGGLLVSVVGALAGNFSHLTLTAAGTLSILYLVVFGSLVGFTAYMFLLRHLPAAKASTYAYINPLIAVLLGVVLLSEPFDMRIVAATVVILGGVGLVQFSQIRSG